MDPKLELKCIEGLIKGDHRSFDLLFMQYHPKVKKFLIGFIKDEDEARDLAQEIFFRLWVNREQLEKVESLKAYLFRMVRNKVYDRYKHKLVQEKYDVKQLSPVYYTNMVEEEIYAKELKVLIEIAIANMPEQRNRIFNMNRKEGLSNEAIALQLGISKRTVENHITQALADIRKAIGHALSIFL